MILQKLVFSANNEEDSVVLRVGDLQHRFGYRVGFDIDHHMRLAAKQAARFDRAPASFWRDVDVPGDEQDPRPHRGFRQSRLLPTYKTWKIGVNPPLVVVTFDNTSVEMDYEAAIKVGHLIRRASRRAKAWAGDTATYSAMLGNLTSAEDDYRLGLV